MAWERDTRVWLAYLKTAGRRPGTVKLRQSQMRRLAASFVGRTPWAVEADELVAWIAGHDWDLDTIRSHRAALRSFYSWGVATGRTSVNPAAALPSSKAKPGRPRPASQEAVSAALAGADDRTHLLLLLGREAGLRACEMATLHSRDLFQDLDGWSVTVHGKGGKDRDVPLTPRLALDLRSRPAGWTFPGRQDGHLSAAYISKLLSRALPGDVTGHQLRHRFASEAYRAERDLRAVQELLGHSSPTTTAIYTAIPDQALRRAVLAAAS